ncbi:MAG: hypothetical protein ABR499_11130 [Gemmatimonadaceae bacterium]
METQYPSRRGAGLALLAAIYVPTVLFLALTVLASTAAHIPLATFSRDPTATLGGNPLTGVQSNLGVLVWWAAAGICFFAGAVLRRSPGEQSLVGFLTWSGSITGVLTLDDLFQFHEDLAVRYLRLDDKLVVLAYGVAVVTYLVRYRRTIVRSDYPLLVAGLVLFAASNAVDVVLQDRWASEWRIFVEDGFKLFGIVSWSAYLIRTSLQLVRPAIARRPPAAAA